MRSDLPGFSCDSLLGKLPLLLLIVSLDGFGFMG